MPQPPAPGSPILGPAGAKPAGDREVPVEGASRVIEGVALVNVEGVEQFACGRCGRLLSKAESTYRWGCLELTWEMAGISDLSLSPSKRPARTWCSGALACPGCASLLDTQICLRDDLPYDDIGMGW